jgi:AcrR family transcriptional regulator
MSEPPKPLPTAGRKRDPLIEPRVYDAAVRVYAREGGAGFSFEAIARAARVGKPALYRRRANREELLVAALHTTDFPTARGSVRADLLDYAGQWVEWYGHPGRAGDPPHRVRRSGQPGAVGTQPGSDRATSDRRCARDHAQRDQARRDRIDGAHIDDRRPARGALSTHWEMTPESGRARLRRTFGGYAESLVDIILAGVASTSGSDAAGRSPVAADQDPKLTEPA